MYSLLSMASLLRFRVEEPLKTIAVELDLLYELLLLFLEGKLEIFKYYELLLSSKLLSPLF